MTFKHYKQQMIQESIKREKDWNFKSIDQRSYYVYRITNTKLNKHYYGSRVTSRLPKEDIGIHYFSSSLDKQFHQSQKDNPSDYKYKVVRVFNNNKDKELFESYLHHRFEVGKSGNFYNRTRQTPFGYDTTGMVTTINEDGVSSLVSIYDERFTTGELVHPTKNTVTAKHKHTGVYVRITKAEFDKNDNLVGCTKDMINVKDIDGNISKVSTLEPKFLSGELVGILKGKIICKDIISGKSSAVIKEEFNKNDDLVSINKGKVVCKIDGEYRSINIKDIDHYDDIIVGPYSGNTHSEETKKKMSLAHKGKRTGSKNPMAKRINIYNEKDELMFECHGDFNQVCIDNGLPATPLWNTQKNGLTLFETTYGMTMAKRRGDQIFKGWYADRVI